MGRTNQILKAADEVDEAAALLQSAATRLRIQGHRLEAPVSSLALAADNVLAKLNAIQLHPILGKWEVME